MSDAVPRARGATDYTYKIKATMADVMRLVVSYTGNQVAPNMITTGLNVCSMFQVGFHRWMKYAMITKSVPRTNP